MRCACLCLVVAILVVACAEPRPTWTESATGIEFVLLPAGELEMGSPESEVGHEAVESLHRVRLSRPIFFGRNEVTQGQWLQVMGTQPSRFLDCGRDCPVENVDAFEVERFLVRLRELTGEPFRLPTEAEWEYACRAGTTTPFSTGANLTSEQANYDGRYPYAGFPAGTFRDRPAPAGSYPPNPWGLFDLHGNVWEWCRDDFCPYPSGESTDPVGSCDSGLRVIRGGSWTFNGDSARCAVRYTHRPEDEGPSLGFRLVRDAEGGGYGSSSVARPQSGLRLRHETPTRSSPGIGRVGRFLPARQRRNPRGFTERSADGGIAGVDRRSLLRRRRSSRSSRTIRPASSPSSIRTRRRSARSFPRPSRSTIRVLERDSLHAILNVSMTDSNVTKEWYAYLRAEAGALEARGDPHADARRRSSSRRWSRRRTPLSPEGSTSSERRNSTART